MRKINLFHHYFPGFFSVDFFRQKEKNVFGAFFFFTSLGTSDGRHCMQIRKMNPFFL